MPRTRQRKSALRKIPTTAAQSSKDHVPLLHVVAEIIWLAVVPCCLISPMCNARWMPSLCLLLVSSRLDLVSAQNNDCYAGAGGDYTGNITTTISGRTCQPWVAKSPHDTSEALEVLAKSGMGGDHHNFCRNWGTVENAPWVGANDPMRIHANSCPPCALRFALSALRNAPDC